MKMLSTLVCLITFTACAQIEQYDSISMQTDVELSTPIGSELFLIKKTRDLPNVFGRADVWGGKVNKGYSELRFMGMTQNGEAIFRYTDIDIESNENVFTRYGSDTTTVTSNTNGSATLSGSIVSGRFSTNTIVRNSSAPEATITQLPPNTIEIIFDPKNRMLPLEGVTVEVIEVQAYLVRYVLHEGN